MFHGSIVAIVTPMKADGQIDFDALRALVEFHILAGTDAIVVVGTTGEAPTLSKQEQLKAIKAVIEQVKGRIPVIAGTGDNSTDRTLLATQHAMEAGADAALIVTPYYNKPTQQGLFLHYQAIASQVPIPIILYNVPARTGCDLLPETIAKLAKIPNIVGVKEATAKIERTQQILAICKEQIDVLSGEDKTGLDLMKVGAKGIISVTANVAPKLMHQMCEHALKGEFDEADKINQKLDLLHQNLFIESNPIPTKWALYKMGLIKDGIRLPLTQLSEQYHQVVLNALKDVGIEGITNE